MVNPQLKAVIEACDRAISQEDYDTFMDYYAEDALLVVQPERLVKGKENIRKAYGLRVGSLLEFVRALLEIDGIPDYQAIVQRQFDSFIGRHDEFSADQVRFLRAVQSVFVQQRRLLCADSSEQNL